MLFRAAGVPHGGGCGSGGTAPLRAMEPPRPPGVAPGRVLPAPGVADRNAMQEKERARKCCQKSLQLRAHLQSDQLASGENSHAGELHHAGTLHDKLPGVCVRELGSRACSQDGSEAEAEQLRSAGALGGAGSAESSPLRVFCFRVFLEFVERYSFYAARTLRRFASLLLYRVSKYFHPCIL